MSVVEGSIQLKRGGGKWWPSVTCETLSALLVLLLLLIVADFLI